jgi:hypothetical protein
MAKKDSIEMLEAKIEVLQRARKKIKSGEFRGICAAIYWSYYLTEESKYRLAANNLRDYISKRLGNYVYLDQWLERDQPELSRNANSMKRYRLQWIDWMLSCLREDLASKTAKTQA